MKECANCGEFRLVENATLSYIDPETGELETVEIDAYCLVCEMASAEMEQ